MRVLRRLLTCEQGQDLVEYSLLIAFVTFSSTALMINSGVSVSTVWTARFAPGADDAEPLVLPSQFLLRRSGDSWQIVVYLNSTDLAAVFAERRR